MLDKLEAINVKFEDLTKQMNDPSAMNDMKRFIRLSKDYKELQPIIEAYGRYRSILSNIDHAKDIIYNEKDEEFRSMAKEELNTLTAEKDKLEEEIRLMLVPADPQDGKNAVVEIRAGTGGDEASLFAGDLYRMYSRFCEAKRWKIDLVDFTEGTMGGFKEIIFNVTGDGAYGQMKYESGVHRVQRQHVVVHHLGERAVAAGVAVRRAELDVEQRGRAEGPALRSAGALTLAAEVVTRAVAHAGADLRKAQRVGEVDGILDDVHLVFQRREDVDGGVGDDDGAI